MVLFGGTAVFSPSEIPHKKIIPESELQFFCWSSEIHHEKSNWICPFDLTFNSFKVSDIESRVNCWSIFHGSGDYFCEEGGTWYIFLKDLANQKWMNLLQSIVLKVRLLNYYYFSCCCNVFLLVCYRGCPKECPMAILTFQLPCIGSLVIYFKGMMQRNRHIDMEK